MADAQAPGPAADPPKDPAYDALTHAFDALRAHDYDAAIASFRKAADLAPGRADIRKNLAYALLKTGENEAAREQFGEAVRIDPSDFHVTLEYAFLCFGRVTKRPPAKRKRAVSLSASATPPRTAQFAPPPRRRFRMSTSP
jgi:Tfp pilus assembly protein PilF